MRLSLSFLAIVAESDDLNDLLLVEVLETTGCDHIVMVLLREEEACLAEALAVESVRILEDLADALHSDVLSQNLLTALLDRWHVEAVSKL